MSAELSLQSENEQKRPYRAPENGNSRLARQKEKRHLLQPCHKAGYISSRSSPVEHTTAVGSTAARLRVVSKCAFAGDLQREGSIQVIPRRPTPAGLPPPFPPVPSTTNDPQSYVFGGRNHPLHSNSQKEYLEEFAARNGFTNVVHRTDDRWSGTR